MTEWKAFMLLGPSRSQLDKLIRSGSLQTGPSLGRSVGPTEGVIARERPGGVTS